MEPLILLLTCGVLAGALSGLFGIGGGSLFVPVIYFYLNSVAGLDNDTALRSAIAHSLICVCFAAGLSAFLHWRHQHLAYPSLKRWWIPLVAGVALGVFFSSWLSSQALAAIFAGILLLAAILLSKSEWLARVKRSHAAKLIARWPSLEKLIAFIVGGLSSLAGIGAGSLGVPAMQIGGLSASEASANASVLSLSIGLMASFLAFILSWTGVPFHLDLVLALGFGSLIGAPLGVKLHRALSNALLNKCFASLLVLVALSIFYDLVT